jgi:hypothetical protein
MTEHYDPPNIPLSKEQLDYRADASAGEIADTKALDCYRNTSSLKILFGACSAEEKAADIATKKAEKSWQKLLQVPPGF